MAYALEIQDVHKVFNRGTINEKVALNGVNLNLNPGDFVTIIGGNGAGKSTTLNASPAYGPSIPARSSLMVRILRTCQNTREQNIWEEYSRIP